MKTFTLIMVLFGLFLPGRVQGEDEGFASRRMASKKEAVVLSSIFPGLGQLSTGHKIKGTILLVVEIGSLATALTANENYDTRLDNFARIKAEYERMAAGNSQYGAARQKWTELRQTHDDLDDLHLIRRAFGAAAVGVYIYNLVDILLSEPRESSSVAGWNLRVAPGIGPAPPKLMVVGSF